jgi:hypothetical protein
MSQDGANSGDLTWIKAVGVGAAMMRPDKEIPDAC